MEGPVKKASAGQSAMPFVAKVVTYRPESLLTTGEMSICQNFRNMFPGIRKRRGMVLLDSNLIASIAYDYCNAGVSKSVGFVATNVSWGSINLYANPGDILTVTTEPVNVSAYQLAAGFTINRALFLFNVQANPYYYNGASIFLFPSIWAAGLPVGAPMPRVCLVYVSTGKALATPYADADYNAISDAISAGHLASDSIIDTSTVPDGSSIEFQLNANGTKYLNDNRAAGHVLEFAVVEYDHDFLSQEPQIETYDDDADEETPEVEIAQQWAMNEADAANCGDTTGFPILDPGQPGAFYPHLAPFSIYQFVKTHSVNETGMPFATPGFIERHTLVTTRIGNVFQADTEPPAPLVTWFTDGSAINTGDGSGAELPVRPSFSMIDHWLLYSDGQAQHKLWTGARAKIKAAFICNTAVFNGSDIWEEVVDDMSALEASITALSDTDAGLMICTQTPMRKIHFVKGVTAQSTNNRLATVQSYRFGTGWVGATVNSDTTITATNRSFGQTGTISFTISGAETPVSFFGIPGYWYRVRPNTGDFSTFSIARLEYSSDTWHPIENVWDGILLDIISAQVFQPGPPAVYYTYTSEAVDISEVPLTTGKIYISTPEQVRSFDIQVGETPNTAAATGISGVKVWTGLAFASVTFIDNTNGFKNSGEIELTQDVVPEPYRFNGAQLATMWYEVTLSQTVSENCIVQILYTPRLSDFDKQFGSVGLCSAVWKDRTCLVMDRVPNELWVSASGLPNVFNGVDFINLQPGDGRKNKIISMRKFHNELMVWQEERGQDGGCVTLFEGFNPATFGKLVLSTKVGALSHAATVVVDGSAAQTTRKDDVAQTKGYWISNYGAFESDGRIVRRISDDIQNYFDQRNPECIRRGFEKEAWIQYDSSDNVLRLGFVSGGFSEFCNIFPVYDVTLGTWSFDEYHPRDRVMSMTEADAASGNSPVLQIGVSNDEYLLMNTGLSDPTDSIDCKARVQINAGGSLIDLNELWVRMKVNAGQTCEFSIYENGLLVSEHSETIDMSSLEVGDTTRRERLIKAAIQEPNIAFQFGCDDSVSDFFLYDFFAHYKVLAER